MAEANDPFRAMGIKHAQWQLGCFYTHTGKSLVPSCGASYAEPAALPGFMVVMHSGRLADPWSSLAFKRLVKA